MMAKPFVSEGSIVRTIWGKSDIILFIFAGAAAEFALNRSVDWLYFTGRLPADPIGRLFSTVSYSREIVFSSEDQALSAISKIAFIHKKVELNRGAQIPESAYRDVLYILIDYSIRSYEILERKLNEIEKEEIYDVFQRVGSEMGIAELPPNYQQWLIIRKDQLDENLFFSKYTVDLHQQYKKHLGAARYYLMQQVQLVLLPPEVKKLILPHMRRFIRLILPVYKLAKLLGADRFTMKLILPPEYRSQIMALNTHPMQNVKKCPFHR